MTRPCYPTRCAAGSEVPGIAAGSSDNAWIVNFDNGNSNWNDRSNDSRVRAVCSGECQYLPTFRALHTAWRAMRAGKRPSGGQIAFETNWIPRLLALEERLMGGTWRPSPPTCFVDANGAKAREIHAPAFADRVVHHWLVPPLERLYEPSFVFDSFSNRVGKGTHAAVERLSGFIRQVESGEGGGYYLQLDINNFFNSIHRPTLYGFLKARMERAGLSLPLRQAVHALLARPITEGGVIRAYTDAERAAVPEHKRLENAAEGCGVAIGNYTSQFFANVYLNPLDQFVKHTLQARRYVRYVDDFVLVHRDLARLQEWQRLIEGFLRDTLRLELKAEQKLLPLSTGVDFLGYVSYPRYRVVRRRVIAHCRAKLADFRRRGDNSPGAQERLRAVVASYWGHFNHANSYRLRLRLLDRFPFLVGMEDEL